MKKTMCLAVTLLAVACTVDGTAPTIVLQPTIPVEPTVSRTVIISPSTIDFSDADAAQARLWRVNGECLDVHGDNGKYLIRHQCHGKSNQLFQLHSDKTIRQGNKCLDIAGREWSEGANVIAHQCTGANNQQWYRDGRHIRSVMNGLCLDASESYIKMRRCEATVAQRFD